MPQLGLYQCETCAEDCATAQAPDFDINECADVIEFFESEISTLYMVGVSASDCTQPAAKPTDWTSPTDWAAVISNSDDNKIRMINVIGDMPAAEAAVINFSKGRQKNGRKTFTVNIDIDEFNSTNYTAMRQLECGFTGFFWFGTRGAKLYGGPSGFKASVINANAPKERGENVYEKIQIVLQFESKCSPEMIDSPIAVATC